MNWQQRDEAVNWHPYTQHALADLPIVIEKGKGAKLWDTDGKQYIDAIASWWCNPHGHANPLIVEAVYKQMQSLEHVLFAGFSHPPAIELSERLLKLLPGSMGKIFYSDNGSSSIEVALKMALQYYLNQGEVRDSFIAFDGAFHGDTFGAMSVSGVDFFRQNFSDLLLTVNRLPLPNESNIDECLSRLEAILAEKKPAAFIFEPLVQGAAGMRIYEADYLNRIIEICHANNVLCIADEVMTGFGKTGKLFATEYLKKTPDIICMSKALTGGFLPMAATACKSFIYDAFFVKDQSKTFFHGHTFTANPSCCAAALAALDLSTSNETKQKSKAIQEMHKLFSKDLRALGFVKNIKQLGVILRWDIDSGSQDSYYGNLRNWLYQEFINQGIIARPLGSTVYVLPPFCVEKQELEKVYDVLLSTMKKLKEKDFKV